MKSKIIFFINIFRLFFQKPSLILKLIPEISKNGFYYSFQKIKKKVSPPNRESQNLKIISLYEIKNKVLEFPSPSNTAKVSIFISTSGHSGLLKRCLWSILEGFPETSFEIIILNNGPEDDLAIIKDTVKNISFFNNELKLEYSMFCNRIAQSFKSELLLFLDSRVQTEKGWLDSLVKLMDSDQTIGMVGPKLVYPDKRLMEAGKIIWRNSHSIKYGNYENPDKPDFNYVREVDSLSDLCFIVRRSIWEDVGGFDGRYSAFSREFRVTDLSFALRKKGSKVVYQPKSLLVSFDSQESLVNEPVTINKVRGDCESFQNKWKNELDRDQFPQGQDIFLARDRSRNKKHILVIDHYVPTFDQDAGSRAMWKYLDLLNNIGYQITFIPDNFFPLEPYTSELEQAGVYVKYGQEARESIQDWIVLNGKYFDLVLLSRPSVSIKYFSLIRQNSNAKIIYYGVDLHFVRLEKEYRLTGRAESLSEMKQVKEEELFLFSNADAVFMFNKEEVKFINQLTMSEKAKKINLFFYKSIPITPPKTFLLTKKQALFVGGFQHRPNVDGITWFSEKVLPLIQEKMKDFHLIIAGSEPPPSVRNLAENPAVEVLGYVNEATLEHLYQESRIAVIPLRFGAGIKGKTVEAMCHGIPVVSTSTGVEGLDDVNRFIAVEDEPEKMAKSIIDLLESPEIWDLKARLATQYARSNFSYKCVRKEFEGALENLL